jgi:hypothetical protein
MPTRDPENRKYRAAIYVVYAALLSWIILCFGIGAAMGVFSTAGKDKLAARQAALLICSAAVSAEPPINIDVCPSDVKAGHPAALLKRARESAAAISDRDMSSRVMDAINSFETIESGRLSRTNLPRLVEGPMGEYLN